MRWDNSLRFHRDFMKVIVTIIVFALSASLFAQESFLSFADLKFSKDIPASVSSERSVAVVQVPDKIESVRTVGDWQGLAEQAHKAFVTMGIDVVTYVSRYDISASPNARQAFSELFVTRNIKNIIYLEKNSKGYELTILPFNEEASMVDSDAIAFKSEGSDLSQVLLSTGREIRRVNHENQNFLIPYQPNFTAGLSIVENRLLKNYPGILRRNKLSVERFAKQKIPPNASSQIKEKINRYNQTIDDKNAELEDIIKSYPYEYELIDPMDDEVLFKTRRQFVLRSITGQAKTLRQMLSYKVREEETDFVSIVPIMPDQTKAMPLPKDAIVHKFFIRQNISKNIHVGEWDADTTWQSALKNMIGNLIQEHNVDK